MLQTSLQAAERLAEDGIEAEVIDLRTLRPLDTRPIVESVAKTNRLVVAEEGWRAYGIGAEIASRVTELAFDHLDAPVRRVAQAEVPLPYNQQLEQMALPQVDHVVNAVKDVLYL
jgi:pyruvate dehydrogenase E1 component beta subunit